MCLKSTCARDWIYTLAHGTISPSHTQFVLFKIIEPSFLSSEFSQFIWRIIFCFYISVNLSFYFSFRVGSLPYDDTFFFTYFFYLCSRFLFCENHREYIICFVKKNLSVQTLACHLTVPIYFPLHFYIIVFFSRSLWLLFFHYLIVYHLAQDFVTFFFYIYFTFFNILSNADLMLVNSKIFCLSKSLYFSIKFS